MSKKMEEMVVSSIKKCMQEILQILDNPNDFAGDAANDDQRN